MTKHKLRPVLRALTVAGALAAGVAAAVPTVQSSDDVAAGTVSVTPIPPVVVQPPSEINLATYTSTGSSLTLSYVCKFDSTVDPKGRSAVTADNVDQFMKVIKSYDIADLGTATYKPVTDGTEFTWTWKLPEEVEKATGLIVRVACADTFDAADTTTFTQAETNVALPPNKFIKASFPKSAKQGEEVTFTVQCDRPAVGAFTLRTAAGATIIFSSSADGVPSQGTVSKVTTPAGFNVIATVPGDASPGDYTVDFDCSARTSDIYTRWQAEERSELQKSPALPIGVLVKELPPLL